MTQHAENDRGKRWFWDAEDQPRHADCGGEVTFFQTLSDEEAAICLACCECGLNWQEVVDTCPDCARLIGFPGSWREHRLAYHGPALVKDSQDGARVDQAALIDGTNS